MRLIPVFAGVVRKADQVEFFYQVYDLQVDPATGKADATARVSILKDGKTPVAKAPPNPIDTRSSAPRSARSPWPHYEPGKYVVQLEGHGQARRRRTSSRKPRSRSSRRGGALNKAELVARVARDTGLTKADVLRALDAVLEQVARVAKKGEPVKLVDFGTFLVSRRRARAAHNPHTGEAMGPGRRWPRFAAGKGLKALVRRAGPGAQVARASRAAARGLAAVSFRTSSAFSRMRSGRGAPPGRSSSSSRSAATGTEGSSPWPWIEVPFGDMYFAHGQHEAALGQRHRLRRPPPRPKVCSPTSFARPASASAAATISPGPAVPLSTSTASGPPQAERRGVGLQQPLLGATAHELRHRPALEEELGHLGPVGRVAPRRVAQVEDEPRRPVPLQRLDVRPHLLRRRRR